MRKGMRPLCVAQSSSATNEVDLCLQPTSYKCTLAEMPGFGALTACHCAHAVLCHDRATCHVRHEMQLAMVCEAKHVLSAGPRRYSVA